MLTVRQHLFSFYHMTIHKEGRTLLVVLFIFLIAVNMLFAYLFPTNILVLYSVVIFSTIIFLTILQFFRSPKVRSELNERYVLAPADGKVVVIEEVADTEYFSDKRKQVSIFMSPINVHVNRNPVTGVIKYFKYHTGKYLVAWHPKSSVDNERTTFVIELNNGIEILFRQIAGALARRIKWYVAEGDQVTQGEEFGFIKFGSRIDLLLPLSAEIKVSIGDKTKGGTTIIAELPKP